MEKAFKEKKCISSKFELARFHQVTDDMYYNYKFKGMLVMTAKLILLLMTIPHGYFPLFVFINGILILQHSYFDITAIKG